MDQRREPRFVLDQCVTVTILGGSGTRFKARVKNAAGRGLGLEMSHPVGIGSALKIEIEDSILLGESMYCRSENGAYFVGVELEQGLFGLGALHRILQAFAGECRECNAADLASRAFR